VIEETGCEQYGVSMPKVNELMDLLSTDEPANLGPEPRSGVENESTLNESLARALQGCEISAEKKELVRALILLWHDHLDSAHKIAQDVDNADGAFVHGIMHRREPDYGNSKYWFRRVGKHPAFGDIAKRVTQLLSGSKAESLLKRLVPSGEWDPFAMVDLCEEAARKPADAGRLKDVQKVETEVLLDSLLKG